MFSLTLQIVQKVESRSAELRCKSWLGLGQPPLTHKESIFMLMCRETIAKTSEVQRYVLNNAAKFGVGFWGGLSLQELLRSLFSSQVLPYISLTLLIGTLVSLPLLKFNYRYGNDQPVCFFLSILEVHRGASGGASGGAWVNHWDVCCRH